MDLLTKSQEEIAAVDRVVAQISQRISEGKTDPKNLCALTGQLMEIAQAERLAGTQKKRVVIDAFNRVTDDQPATQTFMDEIMPFLIDTIKMVARGGLQLAIETRCCGLIK